MRRRHRRGGHHGGDRGEGVDRGSLDLPGRQDELVRAVAAANPATVVVVNSGGPVLLPWREEVPAVLLSWFPGQEAGHGLADVLFGRAEPGGRCPPPGPTGHSSPPSPRAGRSPTPRAWTSATAPGCGGPSRPRTGSGTGSVTRPGRTRASPFPRTPPPANRSPSGYGCATPAGGPGAKSSRCICPGWRPGWSVPRAGWWLRHG
ncbi:glycoside hydrolase family 3 C-terminal domain-containing protein [Streptosporangium lutulentum]